MRMNFSKKRQPLSVMASSKNKVHAVQKKKQEVEDTDEDNDRDEGSEEDGDSDSDEDEDEDSDDSSAYTLDDSCTGDDDSGSESDDEGDFIAAPLSAYEKTRINTIKQNNAVLAQLN